MAKNAADVLLRELRTFIAGRNAEGQTDRCLLEQFLSQRDEGSFAALLERHGPMILGVCRRVLHDEHLAEDVFQATCLLLARKAASIRKRQSVGSWLHGVAFRLASKARADAARGKRPDARGQTQAAVDPQAEASWRESQKILDDELQRLPENYRLPLVLCYLEGLTRDEAAVQLGWTVGKLKGLLDRGRDQLRSQLTRRGVTLSAAGAAMLLSDTVLTASVPPLLAVSTIHAAARLAAGTALAACGVSPLVVALTEGGLTMTAAKKTMLILALVFLTASIGSGMWIVASWTDPVEIRQPNEPAALAVAQELPNDKPKGDATSLETPLPAGAIVRLGTTRFRAGNVVGPMQLSPDGKTLITGGPAAGNGLFVWDAVTGKQLMRLPFGEQAEISRGGERLFVIEAQPVPPAKLPRDPKEIKVIVAGSADALPEVKCALNIYQLATGKRVKQIENPRRLIHFTVAPDERTLALQYAIPDGKVDDGFGGSSLLFKSRLEVYDMKAGRVLHDLGELPRNHHGNGVVRFSADGKTLFAVTCSKENDGKPESTVRRFDLATGALKSKTAIPGTGYQLPRGYHTPLNSDKKTLIASGSTLWDLDQERLHWALKGHDLEAILAFMPDGRTAIAWAVKEKLPDGEKTSSKLVHWDLEADREIRRLSAPASFAAISLDSKTCYGGARIYRWFRWDFASGKEIASVDGPTEPPETIAFSPDGKYVATQNSPEPGSAGPAFQIVRVWDRATGKLVHLMSPPHLGGGPFFFTPDSKTLVIGAGGIATLFVLETNTWKPSKRDFEPALPSLNHFPLGFDASSCRVSPDGKVLATPLALWDWASGKLIAKLEQKTLNGIIAFSPDSKQLTCMSYPEKRVQVWTIPDRKLISDKVISDWPTKPGFTIPHFIDGGKLLATGFLPHRGPWRGMLRFPEHMNDPIPADWPATMPLMPNAVVHVWDAATGKEKFRFQYPQNENMSDIPPLFSPDGKLAVSANYHDNTVRFWDLALGKQVGQFHSPAGAHTMSFSPDSGVLAVSAKDTTVLLVDVRRVLR